MKKLVTLIMYLFSLSAVSDTNAEKAYSMVQDNNAVIIDVREPDETKLGIIKDAKKFPLSKITNSKNWKEEFQKLTKGKTIFLYCRSGVRSGKVLEILKSNGISSQNIGGYINLKNILPIKK